MEEFIGSEKQEYDENYQNHIFEQYRLYVQMADNISARRQSSNNFFLSVNTALITILTFLKSNTESNSIFLAIVTVLSGLILCFTWYRTILSYKQLNTAKFKVIHEIENKLPYKPYVAEWKLVKGGKSSTFYKPLTKNEFSVPFMFFFLYIMLTFAFIC